MYVAIYCDGNPVKKPDLDSAFALPGNYYVFSVGATLHINRNDGIIYYNKSKKEQSFRLNNLELINIENVKNNFTPYWFSIYDHQSDSVKKIYPKSNIFEYALGHTVKIMIEASQFPSWDTYETASKIEEYKSDIKKLKEQVQALKNQNEELTKSLNSLKNPMT